MKRHWERPHRRAFIKQATPIQANAIDQIKVRIGASVKAPETSIKDGNPQAYVYACPCTTYYDRYYDELYALIWPTCAAPASSNPPLTGTVAVEQYIDAQFLHELDFQTISIGSDSSSSSRSSLAGTCHVRTGHYWPMSEAYGVFAEPAIPVSDQDHMACVSEIVALEAICQAVTGWTHRKLLDSLFLWPKTDLGRNRFD